MKTPQEAHLSCDSRTVALFEIKQELTEKINIECMHVPHFGRLYSHNYIAYYGCKNTQDCTSEAKIATISLKINHISLVSLRDFHFLRYSMQTKCRILIIILLHGYIY